MGRIGNPSYELKLIDQRKSRAADWHCASINRVGQTLGILQSKARRTLKSIGPQAG